MTQERTHLLNLLEQFASGHVHELFTADFVQDDARIGSFQLRKNIFKKIWHENQCVAAIETSEES